MAKVKICGLTSVTDAEYVNEAGADYAGIIQFFPKSKRNVSPEKAREIIKAVKTAKTVAVTVSPTVEQIKTAEACGFDYIQIHGNLTDKVINAASLPILKAFNVSDMDSLERYNSCDKIVGYVFDAASPGSGKTFDWSLVKTLPKSNKMTILAGGLTPENAADAAAYLNPDVLDVSSGVENDSGIGKDREKILKFVKAAKM